MNSNRDEKSAYVCGPLTELSSGVQAGAKRFYGRIADVCQRVTGKRAFVPHEHYDPIRHARFTPAQVDQAERRQVCEKTSCLIVVAISPSWGGGIEVEMAHQSDVPIIVLCEDAKLKQGRISRLLRGNPSVVATIPYTTESQALALLETTLSELLATA